jgi:hypothetical protein
MQRGHHWQARRQPADQLTMPSQSACPPCSGGLTFQAARCQTRGLSTHAAAHRAAVSHLPCGSRVLPFQQHAQPSRIECCCASALRPPTTSHCHLMQFCFKSRACSVLRSLPSCAVLPVTARGRHPRTARPPVTTHARTPLLQCTQPLARTPFACAQLRRRSTPTR